MSTQLVPNGFPLFFSCVCVQYTVVHTHGLEVLPIISRSFSDLAFVEFLVCNLVIVFVPGTYATVVLQKFFHVVRYAHFDSKTYREHPACGVSESQAVVSCDETSVVCASLAQPPRNTCSISDGLHGLLVKAPKSTHVELHHMRIHRVRDARYLWCTPKFSSSSATCATSHRGLVHRNIILIIPLTKSCRFRWTNPLVRPLSALTCCRLVPLALRHSLHPC